MRRQTYPSLPPMLERMSFPGSKSLHDHRVCRFESYSLGVRCPFLHASFFRLQCRCVDPPVATETILYPGVIFSRRYKTKSPSSSGVDDLPPMGFHKSFNSVR